MDVNEYVKGAIEQGIAIGYGGLDDLKSQGERRIALFLISRNVHHEYEKELVLDTSRYEWFPSRYPGRRKYYRRLVRKSELFLPDFSLLDHTAMSYDIVDITTHN